MKNDTKKIVFIGVGTMGRPMVKHLLHARFDVTALVRKEAQFYDDLIGLGANLIWDSDELPRSQYVVITVLPDGATVEEVICGPEGLLNILAPGSVVIDMSTSEIDATERVNAALTRVGVGFLDAPVSGGVKGAEAGTLTAIIGGTSETLDLAAPYLEPMTNMRFLAGPVGAGQTAKACNNLLVAACMAASMEALALGISSGLDPQMLLNIIRSSTGTNWQLENIVPSVALEGDFSIKFARSLLLKDLGIAINLSRRNEMRTYLADYVSLLYEISGKLDSATEDFSSIGLLYKAFSNK